MKQPMHPRSGKNGTLTMSWIASNLGIPSRRIPELASHGFFPAVRVGKQWLISPENVERWLDEKIGAREQRVLSVILNEPLSRADAMSNRGRNNKALGLHQSAASAGKEVRK